MKRLIPRAWEELTLTRWRPLMAAWLPAAALTTLIPGAAGEWIPHLMIVGGVWIALFSVDSERAAQKRRRTPYPSDRSLNARALIFALLATGCFALVWTEDTDFSTTVGLLSAGAIFAASGLAYGFLLKLPGIREKLDSTK